MTRHNRQFRDCSRSTASANFPSPRDAAPTVGGEVPEQSEHIEQSDHTEQAEESESDDESPSPSS